MCLPSLAVGCDSSSRAMILFLVQDSPYTLSLFRYAVYNEPVQCFFCIDFLGRVVVKFLDSYLLSKSGPDSSCWRFPTKIIIETAIRRQWLIKVYNLPTQWWSQWCLSYQYRWGWCYLSSRLTWQRTTRWISMIWQRTTRCISMQQKW